MESNSKYTNKVDKQKLLISSTNDELFEGIHEFFGIDRSFPIIIAGPCSIENVEYTEMVAALLAKRNISFLRGGAFKPRSSPYDFQGLKKEGLVILKNIAKKYKLFTVSEIVDPRDMELAMEYVDIIQIGSRNMQNFELLNEVGKTKKPVLLKRGMASTIDEFIFASEYIALQGNRNIIMCERGIRTFENRTRNTLDISSVPIIKNETKLPIIVDLSHSLGRKDIINPIAKAVLSAGADGIMVEVHPEPSLALSDNEQQLNLQEFSSFLDNLNL